MSGFEQFFSYVRGALNHLYDPEYLARSPLCDLLGGASKYDRSLPLQKALIKAIESFRPRMGDLTASHDRQVFDLLLYRYVQRLTQEEMAHQLVISERQLRRDQNRAIRLLASRLWDQYRLDEKAGELVEPAAPDGGPTESFAWLTQDPSENLTDPNQMLVTVIELVEPLATSHSARLASHAPPDLPPVAIHPMAFRQILVVLLGYAIETGAGGLITLQVKPEKWKLVFEVSFDCKGHRPSAEMPSFDTGQDLIELFHGDLSYAPGATGAVLRLALPIFEQQIVFLIDDNPDIAQLFSRYVAGTRFRVHASQDPAGALRLLESLAPSVIVLDVMMPHIDGWDMLKKIHVHPQAAGIPIVVCTILNQPSLAYALGATAFLRKPVTQADLLAALERCASQSETGSH